MRVFSLQYKQLTASEEGLCYIELQRNVWLHKLSIVFCGTKPLKKNQVAQVLQYYSRKTKRMPGFS